MKLRTQCVLSLALLLGCPLLDSQALAAEVSLPAQNGYPKLSPFDDLRWHKGQPDVNVGGTWYVLKAIDGVTTDEIFALIEKRWPGRRTERFAEDLVESIVRGGHECGETVTLSVTPLDSDVVQELLGVEMTYAKRQALRGAHDDGVAPQRGGAPARGVRPETTRREASAVRFSSQPLAVDAVASDLEAFEQLLCTRYSYLETSKFDWRAALAQIEQRATRGMTSLQLALELQEVLAQFGDGHTRIRDLAEAWRGNYLPFAVADLDGQLVAIDLEQQRSFDSKHPYLVRIDDLPIERWLSASQRYVQKGSPQFVHAVGIERLANLAWLRGELGLPSTEHVKLTFGDGHGGMRTYEVEASQRPSLRARKTEAVMTQQLKGNVGYLAIREMGSGDAFERALQDGMRQLSKCTALVIDVRQNGGGSRQALLALYPWLAEPGSAPHVANVGYFRIPDGEPHGAADGYLENRSLYPFDWKGWSRAEGDVIRSFREDFEPTWVPSPERFSRMHLMLLHALASDAEEQMHFDGPVAILTDAGCFSATDIFVAGLQGVGRVKLYGQATGGGSGRSLPYSLPASGIRLRLSSMASFRPDGKPYDGHGIAPELELRPNLEDLTRGTDSVLERTRLDLLKRAAE